MSKRSYASWLVLCNAVSLLAAGCSSQAADQATVVRPVKTMVVSSGGDVHVRSFPGKVEASRKVELAFQVPGLLINFPVKEGQNVKKGEVLGQLRPDEFAARLKALQGQLDQARAGLAALRAGERPEEKLRRESAVRAAEARMANARAEYNRHTRLMESNATSREALEASKTGYRVAQEDHQAALQLVEKGTMARDEDIMAQEGQVRGLEGRVVEAKIHLDDCTLRAPYDGVVAQRFAEQNQNVRAKEPVVKFQDVDEIDVAMDVPESVMISDIRSADIVQMVAEFSGAPGLEFPVRLREIAQIADPTTQTFRVRVAMKAPTDLTLLPGMTATVTLTYRRASVLGHRLLIPITAVFQEPGGEQVAWIIGADGAVERRAVKMGTATGGSVEITNGLQPGDRIAVAGVTHLRQGMMVRDLGDALGGG